ncbi:E3 ubiquitin-protein ligase RNF170-like [Acipenser oxyrinchus oxyrinchus]|uniref:E3 ubiquitin-protein ligase RNF170 n=1 Tax=Acipenser oxyrinchus oxyrinchus TaxID=40147 RepID=A0AAD8D7T3_ACIOX|nr:E3 ubiquitin-protein ligase RNF170-like [Acipenser oxyrinchus oxyrinchus]
MCLFIFRFDLINDHTRAQSLPSQIMVFPRGVCCYLPVNYKVSGAFGTSHDDEWLIRRKESHAHSRLCFHNDSHCPVCLQTATFPVETNCGHLFCAPCLIEYWRHGSWLGAISCPLCRQQVSILCSLFHENQRDQQERQVLLDIRDYNKRFSGEPRPVVDYLYDMPLFLSLVLRGLFTMGGLVWIFCLRIAVCCCGAVVSLSSPLSVIPEPLCGVLGAVDDLMVVFLLLICMININQQMGPERANIANSTTQGVLADSL